MVLQYFHKIFYNFTHGRCYTNIAGRQLGCWRKVRFVKNHKCTNVCQLGWVSDYISMTCLLRRAVWLHIGSGVTFRSTWNTSSDACMVRSNCTASSSWEITFVALLHECRRIRWGNLDASANRVCGPVFDTDTLPTRIKMLQWFTYVKR